MPRAWRPNGFIACLHSFYGPARIVAKVDDFSCNLQTFRASVNLA